MRGFIVVLLAVVLGAGALSIMILPNQQELGTMYLRDQKYDESRALFERQIAEGDLSTQTVSALLSIYLRYGDVDRAIGLTKQFGDAIGDSPEILARLAQLYAADRRLGLYRQTLERLVAIEPTAERLEQLADAHYRAADPVARLEALQRLVDHDWASPQRMLEFADLAVALGRLDKAIDAYSKVAETAPDALDWSYRSLLVELLLNAGRRDDAAAYTDRWLDGTEPPVFQISFAQFWIGADDPQRAVRILDGRSILQQPSEAWRATYILALRRSGRDADAYARLRRWLAQGQITPALAVDLIDLANVNRDLDTAVSVLDHLNVTDLPSGSVLLMISALYQAGRDSEVLRLMAALGPERMAQAPVLAAEIALARGEKHEARRWVEVAESGPSLSTGDQVALANVLVGLGDERQALDLLRALAQDPQAPTEALTLLGELYGKSADAETGYWEINAILARHYTPQLRSVWAELALATGRKQEVQDWLTLTPTIAERTLENLFFMAERQTSWDIAVLTAPG